MVIPKIVACCTLFNIRTVKTVFSLSMTVTTQTAEKSCVKFAINVQLKILNVAVISLRKINCSNFYFYTALIYILCYNSGIAGRGEGVQESEPPLPPPSCQKFFWIAKNRWEFFGKWRWGYYQTSRCAIHCLAVIAIHCRFIISFWRLCSQLCPCGGEGSGVWTPELSKVLFESRKTDDNSFGKWRWGYFQTSHCAVHCLAVIGIHCLFYHQFLRALLLDPHRGSAPEPNWGTSVPRSPDLDPSWNFKPTDSAALLYLLFLKGDGYPLS